MLIFSNSWSEVPVVCWGWCFSLYMLIKQTHFSSVCSVAKLINDFRHIASIFILSPLFQMRKRTNLCGCTKSSWRKAALIDCWHIWKQSAKGCRGLIKGFFTFSAMFLPMLVRSSLCFYQKAEMQMAEPSVWNQNHAFRPEDPHQAACKYVGGAIGVEDVKNPCSKQTD